MYWGYMSILVPNSHLTLCFDFCSKVYTCGGSAGWRRVVYLDMSDNSQQCPSGWTEATYDGLRLCGRPTSAVYLTCASANFMIGFQYTKVCGRAVGYQFGDPVASFFFKLGPVNRWVLPGWIDTDIWFKRFQEAYLEFCQWTFRRQKWG